MSETKARQEAAKLKAIMEKYGVVCSIELQEGRPNATGWGDDWYTQKVAHLNHHTAGGNKGLTPSLALCKMGRGDELPGPLPNGFGGRDFVYRIITMGLANHPGEGGPWRVTRNSGGTLLIPENSARPYVWGTEWEHDGVSPWSMDMRVFMARANQALMEYLDIPLSATGEHKDPWAVGRKVDRNEFTRSAWQNDIIRYGKSGPEVPKPVNQEEEDMEVINIGGKSFLRDGLLIRWIPTTALKATFEGRYGAERPNVSSAEASMYIDVDKVLAILGDARTDAGVAATKSSAAATDVHALVATMNSIQTGVVGVSENLTVANTKLDTLVSSLPGPSQA